ncbi:ABC transporter permease [soil metagenome]
MFKNYFKTAWRNILKNKVFSAINIFGLAIGIAAFLLIVNYLRFEYSFDDFNANKDRIYRVPMTVTEKGGKLQTFAFTYPAVAPAMKKDFPEIEEAVRLRRRWGIVQHAETKIDESGMIYFADASVFNIFSLPFEKGNAVSAFRQLNNAVITQSTAKKYFGNENPVGKNLKFGNDEYVVTAVLKDVPANSHLQFHILLNYEKYIQDTEGNANTSWGWSDFYTYLLLKPGTDVKALQAKMPAFAERYMGSIMKQEGFTNTFELQPLKDIHTRSSYDYELEGNGNMYYLKYLGIAALLILLIALINYINLSTAHSLERSKEVGVRKVIGATKLQLVRQFLSETFLLNVFGIVIGFVLFKLSLPAFSQLIEKTIADVQSANWLFWAGTLALFVIVTVLAGFYPAFVMSSFQPVYTLKSAAGFSIIKTGRNTFRKALVVLQFTAAITLIGGAIGFYRQLKFMSNRDLGVDIKQTLVLQQKANLDSTANKLVGAFINDAMRIPGVHTVTPSSDVPGGEVGSSSSFRLLSSNEDKRCRTFGIDKSFVPNYGLTIVAGRNFETEHAFIYDTTLVNSVLINETAAKTFGFRKPADAVNQILYTGGFACKVIGVVNDYHQQSLQYNFDPIIFFADDRANMSYYALKLNTSDLPQVMEQVKTLWIKRFPGSLYQYFFLDDHFNAQYKKDKLFSTILWLFTLLAIIVASLGLLGLSLHTVSKRTKEISVRKILGATAIQIVALISKDFIKLVLVAACIAIPVAWYFLQNWLKDYAYHIGIDVWFFMLPVALIVVIALLTVLYQSLRAAFTNPAKSLRTE